MAETIDVQVIPDEFIVLAAAADDDRSEFVDADGNTQKTIKDAPAAFANNCPLWVYILAESRRNFFDPAFKRACLGPVGGTIVAETFMALLMMDRDSIVNNPGWTPMPGFRGTFGLADILRTALGVQGLGMEERNQTVTQQTVGSTTPGMTVTIGALGPQVDFINLVDRVADQFQAQYQIQVDSSARQELVNPALPHQQQVDQELAQGNITIQFLEDCLREVLRNARDIAVGSGQNMIVDRTIMASTQRYCPYLFWC